MMTPATAVSRSLASLVVLAVPCAAQSLDWVHTIGSRMPGNEVVRDVAVSGDAFVLGYTNGELVSLPEAVADTAFLRRYEPSGAIVWTRQFGDEEGLSAICIAATSDALYLGGSRPVGGHFDALVRRYDLDGNLVWEHMIPGPGYADTVRRLAVADGAVYAIGSVTAALDGHPPIGQGAAFVRKIDASGAEVWTHQLGQSGSDRGISIDVANGVVYAGGVTFGTFPGETRYGASSGFNDAWVAAWSVDGTELWLEQFGAFFWGAQLFDLAADPTGVFVVGSTAGSFPGGSNLGAADAYLRRYTAAGVESWTTQYGSTGSDQSTAVDVDGDAAVVATAIGVAPSGDDERILHRFDAAGAETWSEHLPALSRVVDVEVESGSIHVGGTRNVSLASLGLGDGVVESRSITGALQWEDTLSTSRPEREIAQAVDASGAIYVGGTTRGILEGQTLLGGDDGFVRCLTPEGQELWTSQFGTVRQESVVAISVHADTVHVVGTTTGDFNDPGHSGVQRIFVRLYDADGGHIETFQLGTELDAFPRTATVCADGTLIAGATAGSLPGYTQAGNGDAFVALIDGAGDVAWATQIGTTESEQAYAVAATDDAVYVGGYTYGSFDGFTNQGWTDAWLARLDLDGNVDWITQFGRFRTDYVASIAVVGDTVVTGGPTTEPVVGSAYRRGFVRRFDVDGVSLSETLCGDVVDGVAADMQGILACGRSERVPGRSPIDYDAIVCKLDLDGAEVWSLEFGTEAWDRAYDVARGPAGIIAVGQTAGSFDGAPHVLHDLDAFVARLLPFDSDGDGLSDADEATYGTDPFDEDTDDDGLLDGTEVDIAQGTGCPNPLEPDSDGDSLLDGEEVELGLSPCDVDSDGDCLPDDLDPEPLVGGLNPDVIAVVIELVCEEIEGLDLTLFNGTNENVNRARRTTLATKCRAALRALGGHPDSASTLLREVLRRLDGLATPPDWLLPSPEQEALSVDLTALIDAIDCL